MSTFDASNFLNTTYTTATATAYVPVPEGVHNAIVGQIDVREGKGKDNKPYYQLIVPFLIDSAEVRELLSRDEVKMTHRIFLDVENGVLATGPGRNVQLGRLREALGCNDEGQEFTLSMLTGKAAKVSVKHRAHTERAGEVVAEIDEIGSL